MFKPFKRKVAIPSGHVETCVEAQKYFFDFFSTQPVDKHGVLIALDDLVALDEEVFQVVAMSHKGKIVLRKTGETRGGFWVRANRCILVRRHGRLGEYS